jgi:hypothetical protein
MGALSADTVWTTTIDATAASSARLINAVMLEQRATNR